MQGQVRTFQVFCFFRSTAGSAPIICHRACHSCQPLVVAKWKKNSHTTWSSIYTSACLNLCVLTLPECSISHFHIITLSHLHAHAHTHLAFVNRAHKFFHYVIMWWATHRRNPVCVFAVKKTVTRVCESLHARRVCERLHALIRVCACVYTQYLVNICIAISVHAQIRVFVRICVMCTCMNKERERKS